jgi:flavin-dependent dehydrogenase
MGVDVVIVGAGPAGSTAAIVLARAGLNVQLLEKDEFPRHKLCGEFLSGDGTDILRSLQLEGALRAFGAIEIRHCVLTSPTGRRFGADLPGRPLSLSRYRLDLALLEEARRSGASVRTGCAATDIRGSLGNGFRIETTRGDLSSRVVVLACGRSSTLDRKLGLSARNPSPDPLVAFKAHHVGPYLPATVELHSFRGGYCGIQPVEDGHVNVCWISRVSRLQSAGGKPDDMVATVFAENEMLARRAAPLRKRTDQFLAVSQLNLKPRSAVAGDLLLVGDSAGMIAPMCGDGMSMAISSAVLAGRLIEAYLTGGLDVQLMKEQYRSGWQKTFVRRMTLGRILHVGYERPRVSNIGIQLCRRFPHLGNWLIRATRT